MKMNGQKVDWDKVAAEVGSLVRPETRSKYFPRNPLRRFIINRFFDRLHQTLSSFSWDSLLDVGCGEGFVDYFLNMRFPGKSIAGLEPDAEALEAAKRLNPKIEYQQGDGRKLPFDDKSFNVVISIEVLEHIEDYAKVIREAARVSRGACVFSVPAWPFYQGMNFMIGKNISRFGEHPGHVVSFTKSKLNQELKACLEDVKVELAAPWLIGKGFSERPR